jgi:hypothetical protein
MPSQPSSQPEQGRLGQLTQGLQQAIRPAAPAALPGASGERGDYIVPPPLQNAVVKPGAPQAGVRSREALAAEELLAIPTDSATSGAFLTINPDEGAQLWADDATDPSMLHNVSSNAAKADVKVQARFAHRYNELQDLRMAQQLLAKAAADNPEFAEKWKNLKLEWSPQLAERMQAVRAKQARQP